MFIRNGNATAPKNVVGTFRSHQGLIPFSNGGELINMCQLKEIGENMVDFLNTAQRDVFVYIPEHVEIIFQICGTEPPFRANLLFGYIQSGPS